MFGGIKNNDSGRYSFVNEGASRSAESKKAPLAPRKPSGTFLTAMQTRQNIEKIFRDAKRK